MTNLKDIKKAIIEKQNGLNADIETLLKITKENELKQTDEIKRQEFNTKEFYRALNKLGIEVL